MEVEQSTVWMTKVVLNGKPTPFKLDTGAEVTAISEETYLDIGKPELSNPGKTLFGPSCCPLKTLGCFLASIFQLYVPWDWQYDYLRSRTIPEQQFLSIFTGLGNLGEEFEICLKPDAKPFSLYTPRHIPLPLRPRVRVAWSYL